MGKRAAFDAFLEGEVETPHGWGVSDCTLSPADWVRLATGQDPAEQWRGHYRTLAGAARIARAAGGLEALWTGAAEWVGLADTDRPTIGDVGLVRTACAPDTPRDLRDLCGAVCIGGGHWGVKSSRGLVMQAFPVLKAWRVEWRTR